MKKFFKKPVLLFGSLAAVVGLGFVTGQSSEVKAQNDVELCHWFDAPGEPHDGCVIAVFNLPCICEGC
ncbi:MAG: hypothetical protein JJU34_06285 [Lunatimonas sp.]|uniref:hypothetical protein n=1 Tax=Lunatimonas sp. TaxID=2060141 RepID=UPI00263B8FC9|nr:hypothetical protein [Lunatimonas sp.]MCC5936871.1 hypothetical protein [Lunatimonas sp.]